jgi:DNA-binding beta-propeller fold protein YncE
MKYFSWVALCALLLLSCRDEQIIIPEQNTQVDSVRREVDYAGFYLLNEGNMGSNKATLDFFNFKTGIYQKNIYAAVNPNVPKELGDVGNDLKIYGSKLYAVINASNKVEVMDAVTARRITQIDIPNCRYITFHGGNAYISSYAGPVEINPDYAQKGYVAKVDTATLQEVARCVVGYQPDELEVAGSKLYVANSGGYRGAGSIAGYERTVSVVDLATFREVKRIDVDYNLHRIRKDKRGDLWVSARGDYQANPGRLLVVDVKSEQVTDTFDLAVSNFCIVGDSLYALTVQWSNVNYSNQIEYVIVNTRTRTIATRHFISDGTDQQLELPYGILVHPQTREVFVADAGNYLSPGQLYCFDARGKKKWNITAGDIPAHFALLNSTNSK